MIELCIFGLVVMIGLFVPAWIVASAARRAGAKRSSFRFAFLAILSTWPAQVAVGICTGILNLILLDHPSHAFVWIESIPLTLVVIWVVFRSVLGMSWKTALLPLAAIAAWSALAWAFAFTVIRPYVAEAFVIPTNSMAPAIPAGTRIVASKLLQPRRWDAICYREPQEQNKAFCKRVVGLPGEQILFKDGNLYVNGLITTPPADLASRLTAESPASWGGRGYHDGQTITLSGDEYFVLGDNIHNSLDSRWYGPAKRSALIGVADLIYWPPSRFQILR